MKKLRQKRTGDLRYLLCISALLIALAYIFSDGDIRRKLRDGFVDDTKFAFEIKSAAEKYGIPPELVRAVVYKESRFDHLAEGKAGEIAFKGCPNHGA